MQSNFIIALWRRSRLGALVAASMLGALVVASGSESSDATTDTDGAEPGSRPEITRPVVVLYGDSLAWESRDHFVAAFAGRPDVQVHARTFGGTAICDWLDVMRADAVELDPGAVVIEFSGNALTACMQDAQGKPLTPDDYLSRYRSDAEAVVETFEPIGAHVYFIGAPIPRVPEAHVGFNGGRIKGIYDQIAGSQSDRVEFFDGGAAVLDRGRWTATLSCLTDEPCEGGTDELGRGVNLVRAPDGTHFCPTAEQAVDGVTGACPVWSSGAHRFGTAMARPVLSALGSPH